ncbi:TolC family outer membrane protein [Vreelandella sp. TE19]
MTRTSRFALSALAFSVALVSHSALAQTDMPADPQALSEFSTLSDATASEPQTLPSLPGLFVRALQHDSDLSRQRLELEATREEIPMARSRLLPEVSASGGYLWQDSSNLQTVGDEDLGIPRNSERPREVDETFYQVQLQQPLFSLERWRGVDVANAEVSAAELRLAVVEQELALQVSEAYVTAYLAAQRLGLLEAQQESLDLQVRQADRAFDLGIGNRVDLLEAQSRYDQAVSDAVEAENELDNALSELERLTGVMPSFVSSSPGELGDVVLADEIGEVDGWLSRTGQNLNVLLAGEQQRVTQADASVSRSGYYPELNLNVSYSDRDSDDPYRESEDYRASVEVSVPIYRGGYTNASVRQGEKRIEASQATVDNERNLAMQEVRRRVRALNGGERRLEALNRAIESGQLFLDAAERGEQLGLRDLVDVLDARSSFYDQRIQYVNAVGDYALDLLSLHAAVGSLESQDLDRIMALLASMSTNVQVAR